MKENVISNKNQWQQRRNKYKKDRYGHILGAMEEEGKDMEISNAFEALNQEHKELQEASTIQKKTQSIKEWVNATFVKEQDKAVEEQSKKQTQVESHSIVKKKHVEVTAEQSQI
ncbi:hypothetical protein FXO38_10872 [Capsicum annuum]|nr:hypothetical protein FXO38_10872 [Capsicum annuum]KAF3668431.1 hypothetical protein FXO37_09557 [Capsicum annuum]